jgi:hypothetical protein
MKILFLSLFCALFITACTKNSTTQPDITGIWTGKMVYNGGSSSDWCWDIKPNGEIYFYDSIAPKVDTDDQGIWNLHNTTFKAAQLKPLGSTIPHFIDSASLSEGSRKMTGKQFYFRGGLVIGSFTMTKK